MFLHFWDCALASSAAMRFLFALSEWTIAANKVIIWLFCTYDIAWLQQQRSNHVFFNPPTLSGVLDPSGRFTFPLPPSSLGQVWPESKNHWKTQGFIRFMSWNPQKPHTPRGVSFGRPWAFGRENSCKKSTKIDSGRVSWFFASSFFDGD